MIATKKQCIACAQLMRLDRPIGTLLLLWPTWWALWLSGNISPYLVIVFSLGVFFMRSAGCVINDFADRDIDAHVLRTRNRPLATGMITKRYAKILFFLLVFISFLLVLTLNWLTIALSFVAVFFAALYPFMKRYTYLPQLFLGITFSSAIPMAYAATIAAFPLTCWLLCIANSCWIIAYDTEYAMVDREDDLKIGVKSTAILFGCYDKLIIGILQTTTLIVFIIIGLLNQLNGIFYILLAVAASLFIWQQKLICRSNPANCFNAFLNNNYVGFIIWLAIVGGILF